MAAGIELVSILELEDFAPPQTLLLFLFFLLHHLRQFQRFHTPAPRGGGLELALRADATSSADKLATVAHDLEMRQKLLLFNHLDLVLLFHDIAAALLLVRKVREFKLMANEPAGELLGEGLVFESFRPDALLGVAARQTESQELYVGLLDYFLRCRRECSARRLRYDFMNIIYDCKASPHYSIHCTCIQK